MAIDAGTVSIGLDADLKQFNDQMKQSAALVAASTAAMRAQLDSLQATLARINGSGNLDGSRRSVEQFTASMKRASSETSTPLHTIESDLRKVAEAAGVVALSKAGIEAFTAAIAKGAVSSTSSMSGLASSLTNVYRAARLAFSPTLFTAGSLAAGYALEKVGEAAYKTAGTLQNQGTIAGLNKVPISTAQVGELAQLGGDKNFSALLGLYNSSGGENVWTPSRWSVPKS